MPSFIVESEAYQAWRLQQRGNETSLHIHVWKESDLLSLARADLKPPYDNIPFDRTIWTVKECETCGSLNLTRSMAVDY